MPHSSQRDTWGSTLGRTRTTSTNLAEARASRPTRALPSSSARRDEDASRYARTGVLALLPPRHQPPTREARVFRALPHNSLTSVPATDTPQFWNEGYREGVEEGKKATVQAGFNVGFREGATAGLAYGQARGAARSVQIFAGQVPGSSGWTSAVAETARLIEEMPPRDAARAAGEDSERVQRNTGDATHGGDGKDADGADGGAASASATFAARVRVARDELAAAGFEHRTFKLEG